MHDEKLLPYENYVHAWHVGHFDTIHVRLTQE